MIEVGKKVTLIGAFKVREKQDDYIIFDSFEKGTIDLTEKYSEKGYQEYDAEGKEKNFDGFTEGDFFKFNGELEVVRSNELFTKLKVIDGTIISVPNHKIVEVE
ncbi:hypothetical protein [Enterococcus sp. AZ103]|uniref:hypothetical protein n=1 Tax=Enterococcus sp. AZ103 TaxID=2774628 RepID=UPI003F22D671